MESFIVRIYRRSRSKPSEVAGLIESVGSGEKRSFQSVTGLITALKHVVVRGEIKTADSLELVCHPAPEKKQAG